MANEFVARNGVIALNNSTVTGSLNVTAGITGSLQGTASWALNFITSSVTNATSASFASTASYFITSSVTNATSASFASTASYFITSSVTNATSASLAATASYHFTSSVTNATSASYAATASYFITSSVTNATSASLAATASYHFTSSVTNATSASLAATSSNILGGAINYIPFFSGSTNVSSSIIYQTGSNIGIGTINPTAKFQVSGSSNVVNFRGSGSVATSSIFTVDGAAGRLFSVNDSLSGSLFSVNTIAGLPVVEAFSDNTVRIGQFGQKALFVSQSRVGIGTEIPTGLLHITGSTGNTFEIDGANASNTLTVSSSGRVGIGTDTPAGRFDISYPGILNDPTILLGADDTGTTTRTNNTTKLARIAVAHYSNTATSSAILAASSTATANILFIGGGSAFMNTANSIQFYTGATTASLTGTEILRLSGSGQIIITGSTIITGSVNISGSTTTNRIIGNSVLPTIAVGTGAGTGPAGSVVGSDLAGAVRLKTGTTPAALAQIGTVTFSVPYTAAPYVIFSAASTASAAISQSSGIYITSSTTGFTAFSNVTALPASTQFTWSYAVFQ
jgi:hypothetical protein